MNKQEYLTKLSKELYFFEANERQQIIDEFESYIIEKINEIGDEEKAIAAIDDPKKVAAEYAEQENIKINTYNKYYVNSKEKVVKTTAESASKIKKQTEKFTDETLNKTKKTKDKPIKVNSFEDLGIKIIKKIKQILLLLKQIGIIILIIFLSFIIFINGMAIIGEIIGIIMFIVLFQIQVGWNLILIGSLFILAIVILTISILKINLLLLKKLKGL